MQRRTMNLLSAFTILLGATTLLVPRSAAASAAACCTSGDQKSMCCGWHCDATMTSCDSCTGFWNCLFS